MLYNLMMIDLVENCLESLQLPADLYAVLAALFYNCSNQKNMLLRGNWYNVFTKFNILMVFIAFTQHVTVLAHLANLLNYTTETLPIQLIAYRFFSGKIQILKTICWGLTFNIEVDPDKPIHRRASLIEAGNFILLIFTPNKSLLLTFYTNVEYTCDILPPMSPPFLRKKVNNITNVFLNWQACNSSGDKFSLHSYEEFGQTLIG